MPKDEQWLLEEKYGGKETGEFAADSHRLACGEPVAYVIGWLPFLGLKIYLDSRPLIPRPETEWWTEEMLRTVNKLPGGTPQGDLRVSTKEPGHPRFLDLCAGSGAIGCAALAKLPEAQVYFGEIDPAHKATILKNIRENNLGESRAFVHIGDLFEPFGDMKFDIVAANPPYIPADRALSISVADYEPATALFAGKNGLDVIYRIAEALPKHLTENGMAWIECDSPAATAAATLFSAQGFRAEIRTDQYGKPRVIVVSFL
ncbi:MAG: N5-glutamine methyltransferase family protein [Minisyncoccota bacterium]